MDKKENQKVMHLFPLTIYKNRLGLTVSEREELIKDVYFQEKQSKNIKYKSSNKGWTGDTQGFEFLFLNKKFNKLFNLISKEIREYIKVIGIHSDKIDLYYQRAWATISRKGENIAMHSHNQSHITFAYYLKKTKDGTTTGSGVGTQGLRKKVPQGGSAGDRKVPPELNRHPYLIGADGKVREWKT